MRDEAKKDKNSISKHSSDEILNGGAMPLDLLQERVEAWIKNQAAQTNKRKPESERRIGCSFSSITFDPPSS